MSKKRIKTGTGTETDRLLDDLHGSLVRIDRGLQRSLGRVLKDLSWVKKVVDSDEDEGSAIEKHMATLDEKIKYLERIVWVCFSLLIGGAGTIIWDYLKHN